MEESFSEAVISSGYNTINSYVHKRMQISMKNGSHFRPISTKIGMFQ
jgi:hypothetical protein